MASSSIKERTQNGTSASLTDSSYSSRNHPNNRSLRTYDSQKVLPRLPIPSLDDTLEKFVKALQALQSPEEREKTKRVVEEFRTGVGPKLQQLLLEYDQEGIKSGSPGSYIEDFWNDSYLTPDASVVLNLNPFFVLEKGPDPKIAKNQLNRAATLTFASLKMASLLKREALPPDSFKGNPLCMDQFKNLFGSTRIPMGKGVKDCVNVYPGSTHVVVLVRNHIYYFQALWPHDASVAVDQHDIKDILEAIQKHVDTITIGSPSEGVYVEGKLGDSGFEVSKIPSYEEALGVLTSLPRAEWAEARRMIEEGDNEESKEALHVIDSALFVLVLDDHHPKSINEKAATMLHGTNEVVMGPNHTLVQVGTCCNRWYDKLQLIVCADGTAGVNFEHSAIDGHTALRYVSDIFAETVVQFAQSITSLVYGSGWIPDNLMAEVNRVATSTTGSHKDKPKPDVFPRKLVFQLPQQVKQRMRFAETALADQIIACDTEILEFHNYGKALIVKNSLSPDSFVQMSMMMAYYKLYGKFVCTYESVLTKAFYHGRTEAMRGATPQAKVLCEVWCDEYASNEEKLEALRTATKEHARLVKQCAAGMGIDRHLFALKCIAERNNIPTPSLFTSDAWKTLNHTVLSTSNCGNPSLCLFGFGPVTQDGFGIGYIIKDHGIQFSVSSKHRQTKRYVNTLENVLLELKRILNSSSSVVCHGSHDNYAIYPADPNRATLKYIASQHEEYGEYGDFYGESILDEKPDSSGNWFSNVVPRHSLRLSEINKASLRLSFDDGIASASSGSTD